MKRSIHHNYTDGDRQDRELQPKLRAATAALEDARPVLPSVLRDTGWQATTALDEPGQIAAEGAALCRVQIHERLRECA